MFLKEAFEMTDIVKKLNMAGGTLNVRRLMSTTVDLRKEFEMRGVSLPGVGEMKGGDI